MKHDLTAAVAGLVAEARDAVAQDPTLLDHLDEYARRLKEPLRLAVVGMPKLGKSTLINAIIGEPVADTHAVRSTEVITWYRHGSRRRVTAYPSSGAPVVVPAKRVKGRLLYELPVPAGDLAKVVVELPATALRTLTLIDTPGIGSVAAATSARSTQFLLESDALSEADAVVYLMRHLHQADLQLLGQLRDHETGGFGSHNMLGVIAGADQLGGGRIDSLISARTLASRYREDSAVRPLLGDVHFVAGLLAQGARNIQPAEFTAIAELAALERNDRERLLVSADRFVRPSEAISSTTTVRADLLERLGIFGIRMASALVRGGTDDQARLKSDLLRQSGMITLLDLIRDRLQSRAPELRARSVLDGLEAMVREQSALASSEVGASLERVRAGAHEYRELELLDVLRTADLGLGRELVDEAERLIGGHGVMPAQRLALDRKARPAAVRSAALAAVARWRELAGDPGLGASAVNACYLVVRSCEGIAAALATGRSSERSTLRLLPQGEPPVGGRQKAQQERRAG